MSYSLLLQIDNKEGLILLLCLECQKVYNQRTIKNNECKVKNCNGEVVEVDELFIPIIAELNKKGYITKYCCSGHVAVDFNSYIYFEDNVKLPNLPQGYKYDQDVYPQVDWDKWQVKNTIRRCFDEKKNLCELSKDIYSNVISLLEWVEGLEEINIGS